MIHDGEDKGKVAFRWSCSLVCLAALALTPASAMQERDPLAPLPTTPQPQAAPPIVAPRPQPMLQPVATPPAVRSSGSRPTRPPHRRRPGRRRARGDHRGGHPLPVRPYRAQHVTTDLITRGAARFRSYRPQLAWLEQRFGVEPQVLMAIFGHETSYGRVTGSFDLLEALAASPTKAAAAPSSRKSSSPP
jgi:membrane-bound lytic murein transglycosylase B